MKNRDDTVLGELQTIRKLIVAALLRSGMTQAQLGALLGVDRTQIGRMFPSGALAAMTKPSKGKKLSTEQEADNG